MSTSDIGSGALTCWEGEREKNRELNETRTTGALCYTLAGTDSVQRARWPRETTGSDVQGSERALP
jgi:hypothetical protein